MSKLVAIVTALAVAACSSPPVSRPAPPTSTSSAPLASPSATEPPAAVPAAPPPAQRFFDGDLGYRFDDPDRKGKLVAAANQVDLAVADEMTRQHLPGLALGIVIDGQLVYSKGYGFADLDAKTPPDLDTAYRVGSLTKSFTSLGVLALRDDGVLTLDDALVRWVPEAAGLVYPTLDARPITLRELLTHTSGLPREYDRTKTATDATFAITCERGRFEVQANLARGKLVGFSGISRGVAVPPVVTKRAGDAMSLLNKWDDGLFARTFADSKGSGRLKGVGAELRGSLGACRVGEIVHEAQGWGIDASCERGTAHFYIEEKKSKLTSFLIMRIEGGSPCAAQ